MEEDLDGKKLLDGKACHTNPLNISKISTSAKIFDISNAKDLKPGSSTYPFPALSISGIHKMPDIKFKGE